MAAQANPQKSIVYALSANRRITIARFTAAFYTNLDVMVAVKAEINPQDSDPILIMAINKIGADLKRSPLVYFGCFLNPMLKTSPR